MSPLREEVTTPMGVVFVRYGNKLGVFCFRCYDALAEVYVNFVTLHPHNKLQTRPEKMIF